MAQQEYYIGSVGPFYYDDDDEYADSVKHVGFRGKILAETTEGVDHGDLDGLTDDDHTQYLKEKASGGTAAETPTHTHQDANNCGQLDHGLALTGLTDDDHTQYFNSTRHDADDHDVTLASIVCNNNEVICDDNEVVWL